MADVAVNLQYGHPGPLIERPHHGIHREVGEGCQSHRVKGQEGQKDTVPAPVNMCLALI